VKGEALSEQALALARTLGDRAAESRALWILILLHSFSGRPRPAIICGERALAIARELRATEQAAFILNGLFMAYWPTGHVREAQEALAEAQALWRSLDNLPMLAENLSRTSLIRYMSGNLDGATVHRGFDRALHPPVELFGLLPGARAPSG